MKVTFKKTGDRRYSVFVERTHAPELMMHPAPGYGDYLPHDVLHFVAEAEWGFEGGRRSEIAIQDLAIALVERADELDLQTIEL